MSFWPSVEETTQALIAEARNDAARLNHDLFEFFLVGMNRHIAGCRFCSAIAIVEPRAIVKARIRGEAVLFECKNDNPPAWAFGGL